MSVQAVANLERANTVRFGAARLRAALRTEPTGTMLAHVLGHELTRRYHVERVLCWMPRWGPTRANGLLARVACTSAVACGQLNDRQREAVVAAFNDPEFVDPALDLGRLQAAAQVAVRMASQ